MNILSQNKKFYNTITGKKILNQKMADRLYKLGYQGRSTRMRECMNTIEYTKCNVCGDIHILQTNRCRDRFCALCQTQLARKRFSEMTQVYDEIKLIIRNKPTAMLTLTIKNCYVDDLKETLKQLNRAWKRLTERIFFKSNILGFAKSIEVTYNEQWNTFHPHLHIILIFRNDTDLFFVEDYKEQFRTLWQKALKLDYIPEIELQETYSKIEGKDKIINAFLEASKYSLKSTNALKIKNDMVFNQFVQAMQNFRFVSYGGIIKEARNKLKLIDEDYDDKELIIKKCCSENNLKLFAEWALNGLYLNKNGEVAEI